MKILFFLFMFFASWNVRGLYGLAKQREVREMIKRYNLSLFGFLETKVRNVNKEVVKRCINSNWSFLHNYNWSILGRIWVCWDSDLLDVSCFAMSDQAIHCHVQIKDGNVDFFVSFVYGDNSALYRRSLWGDLEHQASLLKGSPWIITGDFNAIRYMHERQGGASNWPRVMQEFGECLSRAELDDLKYSGFQLTWTDGTIRRKIDRVLVNEKWMSVFPLSEAEFLPAGLSDHSPMIVKILPLGPRPRRPFKFFDFWAEDPSFLDIVRQVWDTNIDGTPMFVVCSKLKLLKSELKQLNNQTYNDISKRVDEAREVLHMAQQQVEIYPQDIDRRRAV